MGIFLFFCLMLAVFSNAEYEECAYKLSALEEALYGIRNNQKSLNFGFFPSRQRGSRYLEVIYEFEKAGSQDVDCVVTYYWSVGAFLFVQPPSVFQFTSLYFNFPDNKVDNITLQLPNECRPIVFDNNTRKCSCRNSGDTILDILSRHLLEYARYNVPSQVIRDERSTARAICDDELKEAYYDTPEVIAFFFLIILSPTVWLLWFFIFYAGNEENIGTTLEKKKNYPYLVGVACTAIFILSYIFIMDLLGAAYFVSNSHEYSNNDVLPTFNHVAVWILLLFDLIAILTVSITLCCCCKIVKYDTENKSDKENIAVKAHKLIIIIGCAVVCVCSHLGYIVIAWLTEPGKTASIFLTALCVLFFLVAIFRAAYITTSTGSNEKLLKLHCCSTYTSAIIIGGLSGILPAIYILAVFNVVPVPAYELANYFENIIRIILVLVAGIFTYRVLSFEDSEAVKFFQKFSQEFNGTDDDVFENTGQSLGIAAKLAKHQYLDAVIPTNLSGASVLLEHLIWLEGKKKELLNRITSDNSPLINVCQELLPLYKLSNASAAQTETMYSKENEFLRLLKKESEMEKTELTMHISVTKLLLKLFIQRSRESRKVSINRASNNFEMDQHNGEEPPAGSQVGLCPSDTRARHTN